MAITLRPGFLVVGIVKRVLGRAVDHPHLDVANSLGQRRLDLLPADGEMAL